MAPESKATTVELSALTLRFSDARLETDWAREQRARVRGLWLRALLVSVLFQVAFHISDRIDYRREEGLSFRSPLGGDSSVSWRPTVILRSDLSSTTPAFRTSVCAARFALASLTLLVYFLLRGELIEPSVLVQTTFSIFYGCVTVFLYLVQRKGLSQWDALFLVYGLGFYTIPKITSLDSIAAGVGASSVTLWFFILAWYFHPSDLEELGMGLVYCLPSLLLYLFLNYSVEKSARERYFLKTVLRRQHNHLVRLRAQVPENPLPQLYAQGLQPTRTRMALALVPWFLLGSYYALGPRLALVRSYVHLGVDPEADIFTSIVFWPQLFVKALAKLIETHHEAFGVAAAHSVGMALFLLIVTRKVRFLFLTPLVVLPVLVLGMEIAAPQTLARYAEWIGAILLLLFMLFSFGLFSLVGSFTQRVAQKSGIGESLGLSFAYKLPANLRILPSVRSLLSRSDLETSEPCFAGPDKSAERSTQDPGSLTNQKDASAPWASCRHKGIVPSRQEDDTCYFCGKEVQHYLVPVCQQWGDWALEQVQRTREAALAKYGSSSGVTGHMQRSGEPRGSVKATRPCTQLLQIAAERDMATAEAHTAAAVIESLRRSTESLREMLSQSKQKLLDMQAKETQRQKAQEREILSIREQHEATIASLTQRLNSSGAEYRETYRDQVMVLQEKQRMSQKQIDGLMLKVTNLQRALEQERKAHRSGATDPPPEGGNGSRRRAMTSRQQKLDEKAPEERKASAPPTTGVSKTPRDGADQAQAQAQAHTQLYDDDRVYGDDHGKQISGEHVRNGQGLLAEQSIEEQEEFSLPENKQVDVESIALGLGVGAIVDFQHGGGRPNYARKIEIEGLREHIGMLPKGQG